MRIIVQYLPPLVFKLCFDGLTYFVGSAHKSITKFFIKNSAIKATNYLESGVSEKLKYAHNQN